MKFRMIRYFLLLLFTGTLNLVNAQISLDQILKQWDPAVVEKANTAVNAGYLTNEEKLVIQITNLARTDGELFSNTFLDAYLENANRNKYTKSIYKDLKEVKNLPLLLPEKDLFDVASGHAAKSGKTGQVGHEGFDSRFKPLMGKYRGVAENCAYGYEKALDIALQLLVDEDVPSLGHRKNMLDKTYNSIGVSIQPHKSYRYNCVMDFGFKP